MTENASCPLCAPDPAAVVWEGPEFLVLDARSPDLPGYVRLVTRRHVKEMTDLGEDERARLMQAVLTAEECMRRELSPAKVNLAEFGNEVPHVHWHVIPRWTDDAYFPGSAWSPRRRETPEEILAARRKAARGFFEALSAALSAKF